MKKICELCTKDMRYRNSNICADCMNKVSKEYDDLSHESKKDLLEKYNQLHKFDVEK